jgi:hypothetical protein
MPDEASDQEERSHGREETAGGLEGSGILGGWPEEQDGRQQERQYRRDERREPPGAWPDRGRFPHRIGRGPPAPEAHDGLVRDLGPALTALHPWRL